jgi:hypothetical protein
MSTTTPSVFNNRNTPLIAGQTFLGSDESTSTDLAIQIYLCSPTLGLLTVKQSYQRNGPYQITDTFNYSTLDEMLLVTVPRAFAFYHVEFTNSEGNQTYLSLNTFLNSIYETSEFQVTNIVDISGNISGTVDVSSLIDETTATRPVYLMSIGNWYRVATVGNTSGAVWNAIGAIVGGESIPAIGRLFKCLSVPSNIQNQGTVYDVEYTDTPVVSGSVSLESGNNVVGSVKIKDTNGDPIVTTAGNLMVGIGNIYTANPLHTIVDSGSVAISTNPVIVKEKPSYTVNLDALSTSSQTIRSSAGCLSGLVLSHVGGSQFAYVKLYNSSSATSSDTPLATFGIYKDVSIVIDTHAMNFAGGLCARATDLYAAGNNDPPSGSIKLVAFLTTYSE